MPSVTPGSGPVSLASIAGSLEAVALNVRAFVRSQAGLWKQVPAAALRQGVAAHVGIGPDPDDLPITRGYLCISTAPGGYQDLFVDLSSGRIVGRDLRSRPRTEQLVWAGMHPRGLDASSVLAEYRRTEEWHRARATAAGGQRESEAAMERAGWARFSAAYADVVGPPFVRGAPAARRILPLFQWADADRRGNRDIWKIQPDPYVEGGWRIFLHTGADAEAMARGLRRAAPSLPPTRFVTMEQRGAELTRDRGLLSRGAALG